LETQLEVRTRELAETRKALAEALEQQTATSEVLRVISSSPGELQPVFETMLANATRICEATFGVMYLFEGDAFRAVALHGPAAFVEARRRNPILQLIPGTALGRVAATKQTVQIADVQAEPAYRESPAHLIGLQTGGLRTVLSVPMLKQGELIGTFNLFRQEVRPFTDKQIELVASFASQAVIAIENTRLLNELRESLQQQTATADVLKVISRSTFDLRTVLHALVESAARLCRADRAAIRLAREGLFHHVASYGFSPEHQERMQREPHGPTEGLVGYVLSAGKSVHVVDPQADPDPRLAAIARRGNIRTVLGVPMLREGVPIGVLVLTRSESQPFTGKQIELVETFADQAVIAIENVRLFDEVQTRTRELSESLEQQTATGEILASISGSVTDTKPVFDAIVRNLRRLFGTRMAMVQVLKDGMAHLAAAAHELEFETLNQQFPRPLDGSTGSGLAMLSKQVLQFAPVLGNPAAPPATQQFARELGFNAVIYAPMIRDDKVIGAIGTVRDGAEPFNDKQIALIKAFADQAVIAIENVRLFDEVQARTRELSESLEQQTATAEVLRVISSSPGELQPVFDAVLANATRLCGAKFASLLLSEGDQLRRVSVHNAPAALTEHWRRTPLVRPHPQSALGRAAFKQQVAQIEDIRTSAAYLAQDPLVVAGAELGGYRAALAVPMLKEDVQVGVIIIYRQAQRRQPVQAQGAPRAAGASRFSQRRTARRAASRPRPSART
jgi:GAF domain-containing protein